MVSGIPLNELLGREHQLLGQLRLCMCYVEARQVEPEKAGGIFYAAYIWREVYVGYVRDCIWS